MNLSGKLKSVFRILYSPYSVFSNKENASRVLKKGKGEVALIRGRNSPA